MVYGMGIWFSIFFGYGIKIVLFVYWKKNVLIVGFMFVSWKKLLPDWYFWVQKKILIETICKIFLLGLRMSLTSSSHFNPVWCREKVFGSGTQDFHLSSGFCECLRTRKGRVFLLGKKRFSYGLTLQAIYCVTLSWNLLWCRMSIYYSSWIREGVKISRLV